MKPISSRRNQYQGINPHLHSLWQAEGGWSQFHTAHITHLTTLMKAQLLPMGYTADLESSLQVRRLDDRVGDPQSDLLIYDRVPYREIAPTLPMWGAEGVLMTPALAMLEDDDIAEKPYNALAIYDLRLKPGAKGDPVAWIELLSPSNKPGGRDAGPYQGKRDMLLRSGIVFVELDYLNESPPTFGNLLLKAHVEDTYPYHVLIVDPRPDIRDGQAMVKGFHVDDPLPTLPIPLSAGERLTFDFGPAYRKTFEEMLYGLESVDYRDLPLHFDRYHAFDQARIYNRLIAVLTAAQAGQLLEGEPLPVESLPLEDARQQFEQLRSGLNPGKVD
jgi:Protein of unknown function (DUF4058)